MTDNAPASARLLACGLCYEENGEEVHPHPECAIGRTAPVVSAVPDQAAVRAEAFRDAAGWAAVNVHSAAAEGVRRWLLDLADDELRRLAAETQPEPATGTQQPDLADVRAIARRLTAHAVGFQDVLDDSDRGPWARTVREDIDALNAALAAEVRQPDTEMRPRRGDQFEAWLKSVRGEFEYGDSVWPVLDWMLDRYRLHADTGTPLDQHACEGQHCDCPAADQPAVSEQPAADDTSEGEGGPLPTLRERHRAAWNALTPAERDARIAALDAAEEEADRG